MTARKWMIPLILVSLLVFVLSLRQLSDPDLGFHLKYGRWITMNHMVPVTDLSTYTVPQHTYTDLHWLFQVKLYMVYLIAGYNGISLFVCILALALSLLVLLRNRALRVPGSFAAAALLATFLIIETRIAPRPELITFIFLSGTLLLLDLYREHRKNRLYLLPVIMLLWCNMHALFVLGLLVMAIYSLAAWVRQRKPDLRLLGWLAASAVACLINPYGIKGFTFPVELLTRFDPGNIFNQHIQEFVPFFALSRFYLRDYLFLGLLGLSASTVIPLIRRGRYHEVALMALSSLLALAAVRNVPLFVLIAVPVVSREVSLLSGKITYGRAAFSRTVWALLILIPLALIPRLLTGAYYIENNSFNRTGMGPDSRNLPVKAADFINSHHLEGRVLNSLGFGGWLSWSIPQPVFIDGRLEVMQEPLYRELTDSWNGGLVALTEKYNPRVIVYNYAKYYPWTLQLSRMAGWRLVYLDGNAAILISGACESSLPAVNLAAYGLPAAPANRIHSRHWLNGFIRMTDYDSIDRRHQAFFCAQLQQAMPHRTAAPDATLFFNSANLKYSKGDVAGALADYDSALLMDPGHLKAWNNRGILKATVLKDLPGALADFDQAIRLDPGYADAYMGRGTVRFYLHQNEAACRDWEKARSLGSAHAGRLIGLHCNGK